MLINKFWAVCEAKAYYDDNPLNANIAYLSSEVYDSLKFFKPDLCSLIVKNEKSKLYEKFEFKVKLQSEQLADNIFYNNHTIIIPLNVYHYLLGYSENRLLSVRTDIF